MNDYRPPWILTLLRAALGSAFAIIWGGALLWYGMSLDPSIMTSESQPVGGYSFHIMGAILIGIGLLGFGYKVMKLRAPTPKRDKLTEEGEVTFDADAAIARYLASRQDPSDLTPPPAQSAAARPVFGRKQS